MGHDTNLREVEKERNTVWITTVQVKAATSKLIHRTAPRSLQVQVDVAAMPACQSTGSVISITATGGEVAKSIVEVVLVCAILSWNVVRAWIRPVSSAVNPDWKISPTVVGGSAYLQSILQAWRLVA